MIKKIRDELSIYVLMCMLFNGILWSFILIYRDYNTDVLIMPFILPIIIRLGWKYGTN